MGQPYYFRCCYNNSVYHVNISNDSKEVKVFDRAGDLKDDQIIGYVLGPDEKWGAFSVSQVPMEVRLLMDIFNFTLLKELDNNFLKVMLVHLVKHIFTMKLINQMSSVLLKEKPMKKIQQFILLKSQHHHKVSKNSKRSTAINYDPETPNDFPIALLVAEKYGILYIVTKFGFVIFMKSALANKYIKQEFQLELFLLLPKIMSMMGFLL
jgi:hypothetical protein